MKHLRLFKNKKGYSLLEVLVSLGIMAIVITMLFNVLIVGIQSSLRVLARSVVREEIAYVSGLIARDIRNSDRVFNCGETSLQNSCDFFRNNIRYRWGQCTGETTRICKYDITDLSSPVEVFKSSQNVGVTRIDFTQGFGTSESDRLRTVLLTIVASHNNSYVNVNNVFRQSSISTRNFSY